MEVSCPQPSLQFEESLAEWLVLTILQRFDLGQSFLKMEHAGGDRGDLRGLTSHHLNANRHILFHYVKNKPGRLIDQSATGRPGGRASSLSGLMF